MPGDTTSASTSWFAYFWRPRAAARPPEVVEPAPRKTYREALLANVPSKAATAAEHDALLQDTYLFV